MAETIKNAVAAVNQGVAAVAERAQVALGTVHDKAAESAQTGPQKVDEVGVALSLLLLCTNSAHWDTHHTHRLCPPPPACM